MVKHPRTPPPSPGVRPALALLSAVALSACSTAAATPPGPVAPGGVVPTAAAPGEWRYHGRDLGESRYSPLDQVTSENVASLALAWSYAIPKRGARLEATPIVTDGVMYATGPLSTVYALDARTGAELWFWDPAIPLTRNGGPDACCGDVNRGVALYGDKLYVGLLDGRLVALNRADGSVAWTVQTTPPGSDYTSTGAPRVFRGRVVIGNGGAEFGVRGYLTAYDAETGEQLWRTYTVPGNPADGFESEAMRVAAETWTGTWWKYGGGGTVWDGMAYDPSANLLYIGTGNGSPWNRDHRSPGGGDNLYLSSIIALDGDTGEYVWHYQTTPGDDWDYTATQPLMLLDVEIDGRERQVIVQAPKNGFFYVIDRLTGELLSAEAFADDLTWATGVDPETGRPMETPHARYGVNRQGAWIAPGPTGAHNWWPMAWNREAGLVYIPMQNNNAYYEMLPRLDFTPGRWNTGTALLSRGSGERPPRPAVTGPRAALKAWDPAENREVWRFETGGGNGGVLSTGGNLVFWGTGDRMVALDATTGAELWSATVGRGTAPPITYTIDGVQYVAIAGGQGNQDPPTVRTFTLGGRR